MCVESNIIDRGTTGIQTTKVEEGRKGGSELFTYITY